MGLEEYLGYLNDEPRGGFGAVPIGPIAPIGPNAPALAPGVRPTPSAAVLTAIQRILSAPTQVDLDQQMWTLDSRWLAGSEWKSMKSCVSVSQDFDVSGHGAVHVASSPWTTQAACGHRPHCMWGYWQINRCSLDLASNTVFQFPRYLWAQAKMRELLRSKPQRGVTSADDAAAWVWAGAQLLSVLFWSTNVRFNNPETTTGITSYAKWDPPVRLASQRVLGGPVRTDGEGGLVDWRVVRGLLDADFVYDGAATPYSRLYRPFALFPRVWNLLQNPPETDDRSGTYSAAQGGVLGQHSPQNQNGFNPGNGLFDWLRQGSGIVSPYGMTDAQVEEVRMLIPSPTDTTGWRWGATKAMLVWWFRQTWDWPTMWQYVGDTSFTMLDTRHTYSVVVGGAAQAVDYMVSWLTTFSDSNKRFTDWMQYAFDQWNVETAGVGNASPTAISFVRAKGNMQAAISAAVLAVTSSPPPASQDAAMASQIIQTSMAAIMAVVTAVFPIAGLFLSAASLISNIIGSLITSAVGPAVGWIPCTALPYIRVMAPPSGPCDLTVGMIESSISGINSNAQWPVFIGGQTRNFLIDGQAVNVAFTMADADAASVARRINAAAALVGLGTVATVVGGQVHVQGTNPTSPPRAIGGTATALGFPGPLDVVPTQPTMQTCPDGSVIPSTALCPPPPPPPPPPASKPSAVPVLVGGAAGLWLLAKMFGGKAAVVASAAKKR